MTQKERIAALEARVDDLVKLVATLVEENVALRADMAANLLMGRSNAFPGFPTVNPPVPTPYPFVLPQPPPPPLYPTVAPYVPSGITWEIARSFPIASGSSGHLTIQHGR